MIKICNRCKVNKDSDDFKTLDSKICKKCCDVSKDAYKLKTKGILPKYAKVQKELEEAYKKGNFICNICNEEKTLKSFGSHSNANKYNISRVCKECSREKNKISNIKDYGISKEDFAKMLEEQESKCKICNKDIKYISRAKEKYESACIDHDHKTGKVRALLCSNCNRGLGLLKDDETILYNAYKYVVQYKSDKLLETPK